MPSEMSRFRDSVSGVEVTQLTDHRGHSHHLYFTNPGWYAGGRKLLVASDRGNRSNLYGVDLASGELEQLTDLAPVPLPRELEFCRACKNPLRDEVCFWHDRDLMLLDIASRRTRSLLRIDPRWCVSMTNISADGRHVYFGSWEDQSHKFPVDLLRGYVGFAETWAERPLSRIERVELATGKHEVVFEEQYWIGHVNTSPTRPDLLTYCHEGPWDKVDQRIWLLDLAKGAGRALRPAAHPAVIGHEYWFADGERIGYHGKDEQGRHILGRIRHDGSDRHESGFPGWTGHIFSRDESLIVGDGGDVIRLWLPDGDGYAAPRVLCRHWSGMRIQQTHPHPVISPDGSHIVYTSDGRTGYGNVFVVRLDGVALERLPVARD